jgi:hypothetical protein
MNPNWADAVAEDMHAFGALTDATFRGIVREMDRLTSAELRALVAALLAFGPEPVAAPPRTPTPVPAAPHRTIGRAAG